MTPTQTPITGNGACTEETLQALTQFYAGFNGRDLKKVQESWAQSEESSMDNPLGGIKRGWEEIRGVYERLFAGPATVYVEFYDYTIHEAGDIFYAVGRERGEFRVSETMVPLAIRTTRIFRRIGGTWKQVHHHGSIEDPELLAQYQRAVKGEGS